LLEYDVPFIKIPSAMLTNAELLIATINSGKKIIISTGMSTLEEIDTAVALLKETDFALLHCNSTYPAPLDELNLKCIQTLKDRYNCEVGYSGHEFRLGTSVAAVYLGATIIERHITLDRTMWGSDHLSSVEPQGLIKLVKGIKELETAYGDGIKRVTKGELAPRKKLRGN
jgi:N-acetylneuraminate synthase